MRWIGRRPWAAPWLVATHWSRVSQEDACRNAMAASTLLLQRRRERLEVQQFITTALTQRAQRGPAPTSTRASHAPPDPATGPVGGSATGQVPGGPAGRRAG